MTTYNWDAFANGAVVDPFDPNTDTIEFGAGRYPYLLQITPDDAAGTVVLNYSSKTVTVHMTLYEIAGNFDFYFNFQGVVVVGDNTHGTTDDDLPHTITGGSRLDHLIGGNGDDTLDGGQDVDTMEGRGGNDTYYVDQLGDRVIEVNAPGIDTVYSTKD